MKKEKKKKIKVSKPELIKSVNEDTGEIKKFIFILIGVALVALLLYVLSSKVLLKDGIKSTTTNEEVKIDYDVIDIGTVFNRPYDNYYVMAYDFEALDASLYSAQVNVFSKSDMHMYSLDLSTKKNKEFVGDGNKDATKPSELSLQSPTLIKISNGKIVKYIEDYEEIKKELE